MRPGRLLQREERGEEDQRAKLRGKRRAEDLQVRGGRPGGARRAAIAQIGHSDGCREQRCRRSDRRGARE